MALPTSSLPSVQLDSSRDVLHIKDAQGNVVSGIDSTGAGVGVLAGATGPAGPTGSTGAPGTSNVPWLDIQSYGGVPKSTSYVNETTTATASYNSTAVILGAAKHFANGMGVCIWKGGPACTITSTPGAPASAIVAGVTGSGPSADTQTINYQVVGYDAKGGLTAASASLAVTAPSIFGPVPVSISSISQVGTTVTINFSSPLNADVVAGMTLHLTLIGGSSANAANGVWTIATAPSTSQVTITLPAGVSIGTPSVSGATGRVSNSALIYSISRSASGVVTVTTTEPHNYIVGAIAIIKGVAPVDLNGHFPVATVPTATTFTYNTGICEAETGSGGYVTVWEHIVIQTLASGLTIFPTHTLGYYVYSDFGLGGSFTLIGKTLYGESHFTDYGQFYGGGYVAPAYVPTTAPASAQNQMFTSTIASGGGTTSLVLNDSITNTGGISGATIMYDDGPCLVAALTAQGAGTVILSPPQTPTVNTFYIFNSPISVRGNTDVLFGTGCIINETITLGGNQNLSAAAVGTANVSDGGPFGQQNYVALEGLGNPMIYSPNGAVTMNRLGTLTGQGSANTANGLNAVMLGGWYNKVDRCSFYVGANGTSCPLIFGGVSSALHLSDCSFQGTSILGGTDTVVGQSNFCPPVPILWFRTSDNPANGGDVTGSAKMTGVNTFNGRAVLIDQTYHAEGTALGFDFGSMLWNQGASQPFLMVLGSVTDVRLDGVLNDSSFCAALANWGNVVTCTLTNFTGAGSYPPLTGLPVQNFKTDCAIAKQNISAVRELTNGTTSIGAFQFPTTTAGREFDLPVYINKNGALFVLPDLIPLTLSASGSGTWAAGIYTVQLFFQGWDGGIFVASLPTTVAVTLDQEIVVSWTQESGWQGAYVSVNGQIQNTGLITGATVTLSGSATYTTAPTQSGSGLPLVSGSGILTPQLCITVGGAPASATSAGTPGQIAWDATHIYVCVAKNTWVRATLATF